MKDPLPTRPLDLTTQQLRTFCAVYEHGGYSVAARSLGLSTTATWEQVKELERQYKTRFFIRHGRQVVRTQEAERLHELLGPILAGLDTTRRVIREERGDRPREIRVAVGARMLIEEVSPGLDAFRRANNDIRLRVMETHSNGALTLVQRDEADVVMSLQRGPGFITDDITLETAYDVEYLLIAPLRHPIRRRKTIRLANILEFPLVLWRRDVYSRHIVEQALHKQGLLDQANIAVETDNSAFTAACVRAGLGLGLIAGQPGGTLCRGLFAKSLARTLGRPKIVFLWRRGAYVTPLVRELADTIRRTAEKLLAQNR